MSPERIESKVKILDESEKIKKALLAIEEKADAKHSRYLKKCLKPIRAALGYTKPKAVDTGDIIDKRVAGRNILVSPEAVTTALPITQESADTTQKSRQAIERILEGKDDRIMVVVGPCSIHDPEAAIEYAKYIKGMRETYGDDVEIVMRAYSEKPRTELGWKGFVNDPLLDESNDMNLGLIADRMLALQITGMGVPIARERLNIGTPQYVDGLIALDSIGARTI